MLQHYSTTALQHCSTLCCNTTLLYAATLLYTALYTTLSFVIAMVGGQSAFVELTKIFDQCRFATGGTVARMVWRKMKVKRASGIGMTRIVAQTSEMMMTGVALMQSPHSSAWTPGHVTCTCLLRKLPAARCILACPWAADFCCVTPQVRLIECKDCTAGRVQDISLHPSQTTS